MEVPLFNYPDADIILTSGEKEEPTTYYVHRCILAAASPFFHDMFSLPQSVTVEKKLPTIPITESRYTLGALLQFVYPTEDPPINSLDELAPTLSAAIKYDFTAAISTLRKLLISPRFAQAEPVRVYAIACRLDLEEEMQIASKYTLSINILDAPLSDDLKFITAHSYHRLLDFHRRRVQAALEVLKTSSGVKCMQCNGSIYSAHVTPKWWLEFERRARQELSVRPTSDVIFELEFLARAAVESGCTHCARSVLDSWRYLQNLKKIIDELPTTV